MPKNSFKGFSRLLILFILCTIFSSLAFGCSSKPASTHKSKVPLTELTDSECIDFVKNNGIKIPDDYKNLENLGAFIKTLIIEVDRSPDGHWAANYTVLVDFMKEISAAVQKYYYED